MKSVALVATGSELVYGSVEDRNNSFLSRELFKTGFRVILHMSVGDDIDELKKAFVYAAENADIVVITGGLGPTDDDYTTGVLRSIYGFHLVIDQAGRRRIEEFFKTINRELVEGDLKMVTVPENAHLFMNDLGLATGFCLEKDGKIIIVMPGVPREMQYMFEKHVIPFLHARFLREQYRSVELKIAMKREAEVNLLVKQFRVDLENMVWGITTSPGLNTLVFVQKEGFEFREDEILSEASRVFGNSLLPNGAVNLESEVVRLLDQTGFSLAVAESCTGGLLAKKITDIPGSSKVFAGGVVAYGNESKKNLLAVPAETLETHGAVSEETARAMVLGARAKFATDVAVSITGIAGPGGGTDEKPVGTVCFGVCRHDFIETFSRRIIGDRERVRLVSTQYTLERLRQLLMECEK